ncbi:heme ABC transporter ATP-binding protein [Microbacterium terregens]|uniref:Heme ABC transporter ATP-binding protein n=1 Tax=Microbacterium terregens TaxID=69363 RepID=A0ABV5SWD0_9MICO
MSRAAFAVHGVGYAVGDARILEDVTLRIRYGRLLALVGPNGAGKSSLLGVLTGDRRATAGRVLLDDRPLADWAPRRLSRMRAVLTQSNQVAFSFTAREVVEMGRAPWIGTDRAGADAAIIALSLAQADVARLAGRTYPSLSGGEKARVSLARVLAQDTPIVLLDEPTAALDLRHQEDVLRIARDLARAGRAVVVVLHDLSLAGAYADDIAMMHHGRIVAHGSPEAVLTEQRVAAVYDTPVRVLRDPDTGRPIVLPRR